MKKIFFILLLITIFVGCSKKESLKIPTEVLELEKQPVEIVEYENEIYIVKDGRYTDVAIYKEDSEKQLIGCVVYIIIAEALILITGIYIIKRVYK